MFEFRSSEEKLENALFSLSRTTKEITQSKTSLPLVFLNCKDGLMTFSRMTSDHLARHQASKQGLWPAGQEHGWLLPSSPAAQLPACWQLPPFSPWPDASSFSWLLDLPLVYALAAQPAGRVSPSPRISRHPSGVQDLQQTDGPKRTTCLCQRFQTTDISFQCKINQSLHPQDCPLNSSSFPSLCSSSDWRLSSTETDCGAVFIFSSILVHAKFSKTFFGIR